MPIFTPKTLEERLRGMFNSPYAGVNFSSGPVNISAKSSKSSIPMPNINLSSVTPSEKRTGIKSEVTDVEKMSVEEKRKLLGILEINDDKTRWEALRKEMPWLAKKNITTEGNLFQNMGRTIKYQNNPRLIENREAIEQIAVRGPQQDAFKDSIRQSIMDYENKQREQADSEIRDKRLALDKQDFESRFRASATGAPRVEFGPIPFTRNIGDTFRDSILGGNSNTRNLLPDLNVSYPEDPMALISEFGPAGKNVIPKEVYDSYVRQAIDIKDRPNKEEQSRIDRLKTYFEIGAKRSEIEDKSERLKLAWAAENRAQEEHRTMLPLRAQELNDKIISGRMDEYRKDEDTAIKLGIPISMVNANREALVRNIISQTTGRPLSDEQSVTDQNVVTAYNYLRDIQLNKLGDFDRLGKLSAMAGMPDLPSDAQKAIKKVIKEIAPQYGTDVKTLEEMIKQYHVMLASGMVKNQVEYWSKMADGNLIKLPELTGEKKKESFSTPIQNDEELRKSFGNSPGVNLGIALGSGIESVGKGIGSVLKSGSLFNEGDIEKALSDIRRKRSER